MNRMNYMESKYIRGNEDRAKDITVFYKGKDISHRVSEILLCRVGDEEWLV